MTALDQLDRMRAIVTQLAAGSYAGMAAADIAAALNAPSTATPPAYGTVAIPVPTKTALAVLLASGHWGSIKAAAQVAGANQGDCITLTDAIQLLDTLETDDAGYMSVITALLGRLVTAGLLDSATETALLGLAAAPLSWAQATVGGDPILPREVQLAQGPASDWGG